MRVGITKDDLSDVGFEPTPTYVDQNTHTWITRYQVRLFVYLESGALDRSANLTDGIYPLHRKQCCFEIGMITYLFISKGNYLQLYLLSRMNLKPYKWWIFGCRTFYLTRLHLFNNFAVNNLFVLRFIKV